MQNNTVTWSRIQNISDGDISKYTVDYLMKVVTIYTEFQNNNWFIFLYTKQCPIEINTCGIIYMFNILLQYPYSNLNSPPYIFVKGRY